jgi:hypothetical protein
LVELEKYPAASPMKPEKLPIDKANPDGNMELWLDLPPK